jgi:hypothetical protein
MGPGRRLRRSVVCAERARVLYLTLSAKLWPWTGLKRSRPPSTAYRLRITAVWSRGFASMNRHAGMNRWIGIRPAANWTSCSMRPKVNQPRGYFVSGRREREVTGKPPLLGIVPGIAVRRSGSCSQELSPVATRSPPSVTPLQTTGGKPGPVHRSGWRPLSCTRKTNGRHDYVGLDRVPHRL